MRFCAGACPAAPSQSSAVQLEPLSLSGTSCCWEHQLSHGVVIHAAAHSRTFGGEVCLALNLFAQQGESNTTSKLMVRHSRQGRHQRQRRSSACSCCSARSCQWHRAAWTAPRCANLLEKACRKCGVGSLCYVCAVLCVYKNSLRPTLLLASAVDTQAGRVREHVEFAQVHIHRRGSTAQTPAAAR